VNAVGQAAGVLDHVAVAVPSLEEGRRIWRDEYGGGIAGRSAQSDLETEQYRYQDDCRIELIAPPVGGEGGSVIRFLERFGPGLHHITVKVPDLGNAIEALDGIGISASGISTEGEHWHEAFISPRATGLPLIQVAWTDQTVDESAARNGIVPDAPKPDAIRLVGAHFHHEAPRGHRAMWETLGAAVTAAGETLTCTWPGTSLTVLVSAGSARPRVLLSQADDT